jgi:eukaryotic-like serine/threonine-protein kinase
LDYDGGVPAAARIGEYELREPLGSAGLTETYRARGRPGGPRAVAVKLLRLDRLPVEARGEAAERFLAAGRRALAATVGGMARVIEVGEDRAGPFVATELLPGIDLAGLVHFGRKRSQGARALDPALAAALGAQVARILTSAHEAALPHLGLSPSNVRITPAAAVVVTDFGLAAALRGQADTRISRCFFLPPELLTADGATATAGESADLYSLGAVLYFLLAGRPPVEAESLAELLERAWEPPPALPAVPADLDRAIRALLAPEPAQRPASARAAADLLAGGMASAQERHQHIAAALRALDIDWRGKKAGKGNAGTAAPHPTTPAVGPSALPFRYAARRARRRWGLLIGIAAGLAAAAVASVLLLRLPRNPARPGAAPAPLATPATPAPLRMHEIPPGVTPELHPTAIDGGLPTDRTYMPAPKRTLHRVPGHLDIDTVPSGAEIWVDGARRGTTPVDLILGEGGHRVVLLKEGFRMHRDVYDTTRGEWIRRELVAVPAWPEGGAYVNVTCRSGNHLPVFVDDEETGRLCPVVMLPVIPGQRKIAVFVPARRGFADIEVSVPPGKKPLPVTVPD